MTDDRDFAPAPESASDPAPVGAPTDLSVIETDLADVERALARLDDGTYWTCEVTGSPIPDGHLIANPLARRAPDPTS